MPSGLINAIMKDMMSKMIGGGMPQGGGTIRIQAGPMGM